MAFAIACLYPVPHRLSRSGIELSTISPDASGAQFRVLLERRRAPPGDVNDATRHPSFYDETYAYLTDLGLQALDAP